MAFHRYFDFEGRSQRSEYWFFFLFNVVICLIASRAGPFAIGLYGLAVIIPGFAVSVRRLHDTNRSVWWMFIVLVPVIGIFVLIYWMASEGDADRNRYGDNPKNEAKSVDPDDDDSHVENT